MTRLKTDTLWRSLPATTHDSLPTVVQTLVATASDEEEQDVLDRFADVLQRSRDVDIWTATLTGLGLATLERYVSSFTTTLELHGVPRSQWSFASGFASTEIDLPQLSQAEQWQGLRDAILAFRASTKRDLRSACLDRLPSGYGPPPCDAGHQAIRLLACLVVRSIKTFTFHAMSKSKLRQRNCTGASFISAMPWRMRDFSSAVDATRMWRRNVRAILEKAHSIRFSQEPCFGV